MDISDSFLRLKLNDKGGSHIAMAVDFKNDELVILDIYEEGREANTLLSNTKYLKNIKTHFFDALDRKENMHEFISMYCKANDIQLVDSLEEATLVVSYNDIRSNKDEQELFNVSDNLEKIVGLLA